VPNEDKITACSWNRQQGFVAVGTENGIIKVIKLEMNDVVPNKSDNNNKDQPQKKANSTNLVMNETLEVHTGQIASIAWNDSFTKLTTADTNGKIIVWINQDGKWYEEMVNKRDDTIITGMKWSSDGQNICIIYNDGVIILGSLEGSRIWVKELKNTSLTNIEWSPDKRLILFGLANGEIHVYDFNGNYLDKLKIYCLEDNEERIAGIDWYDGHNGFLSPDSPALVICYANGRCQIMTNESEEKPIIIDCQMEIVCCQWNHDGSILLIGGIQMIDDRVLNLLQFYTPWGQHLKSLKVPGTKLKSASWEGNSLRIVIAIDSFIYFANIRPSYKWAYFNNNIVYSFMKPLKMEQCVLFYDIKTGQFHLKYAKRLLGIIGGGDYCALISQCEDSSITVGQTTATTTAASISQALNATNIKQMQYSLVVSNSIGTPLETKYLSIQPNHWCMSQTHIVIASRSYFYIWNYLSSVDKSSLKKQSIERLVFIENPNTNIMMRSDDSAIVSSDSTMQEAKNSISCVALSDKFCFIGRESGVIQKFDLLNDGKLIEGHESNGNVPLKITINSDSTRMAVIDTSSSLRLIDLTTKTQKDDFKSFKRSDVWNVVWADDNPSMFVSMEKIKMLIFRETQPEEPCPCSGYICSFNELQVKAVLLDDIMQRPESPGPGDIVEFDTKSLRDAREHLEKNDLKDATTFIEQNSHEKLWKLLAETALKKLELKLAEHAFVKLKDYYGIEFIKRLNNISDAELRKAEVAAFYNNFDESESIYLAMDRKDLAYQLRKKLGDWFKVLQLLKATNSLSRIGSNTEREHREMIEADIAAAVSMNDSRYNNNNSVVGTLAGTDSQLEEAYFEIGEYYSEQQRWDTAVKFYTMGRNLDKQAECYYNLEDYDNLSKVLEQTPENNELLIKLAQMFESVGMCSQACEAYLKAQNVKGAVDTCVKLNQWDEGIRLAKQYNISQVDVLLAKQANNFLEQKKVFNAIELYRKARHYLDAARLMFDVAEKEVKLKNSPLLIKKTFVLGGLLVEQYRDLIKAGGIIPSKIKIAQRDQASKALDGMLNEESQVAIKDSKILDNAWRGAEAYHFMMLCQRQLRAGTIESAFKTSMALMEYEDILDLKHIYSLIGNY
jgi:WD repeat-containing protein 35